MHDKITIRNLILEKYEAVMVLDEPLPSLTVTTDAMLVLFLIDLDIPMTLDRTKLIKKHDPSLPNNSAGFLLADFTIDNV